MQDGPWKLDVHKQYVVPLVELNTQVPPLAQAGEQVVLPSLEATTPARSSISKVMEQSTLTW